MNNTLKLVLLLAAATFSGTAGSQNALDFDGTDDKVDCGNDTSLQISGTAITLEAWIFPTAWKTNIFDGNVINKEYNTSNYGFMLRVGDGGRLNFAFGNGSWHELNSSTAVLSLNTWQHIAGTYDGQKMRIYVNGKAVDSLSETSSITNASSTPLLLGGHTTYTRYYQGMMDEVRVWNICLKQQQLSSNMSNELCARHPNLKAYYKFNQGKVAQANPNVKKLNDLSGYNNAGTLLGFALNGSGSNWVRGQDYKRAATYAYDTADVCDRFLSQSKRYTWTKSGMYNDTIPTVVMGCDSVIITSLTVRKSTTQTLKVYACNSYKSPSGLQTWTKSGLYTEKIKNKAMCDSTVTVQLKIGGSRDTVTRVACNSYTGISGKRTYTVSGIYSDTLAGYMGCDSIFVTKLTINKTMTSAITVRVCNAYTIPSGKRSYAQPGLYYDTLKSYKGCDSIIAITLQILKSSGTVKHTACNKWKSPSGNHLWSVSGIYHDTIVNSAGCDSFVTVDLTILKPSSASLTASACRWYRSPSKKYVWTGIGVYKDTIPNAAGCDSVITVNLTINTVNTNVTQNVSVLTAQNSSGTCQWLDCNNGMAVIPNATAHVFKAKALGKYAVAVTAGNCTDTSACYTVSEITGIDEQHAIHAFQVIPNPSAGTFKVRLPSECSNAIIYVRDVSGRIVWMNSYDSLREGEVEVAEASGLYFIEVSGDTFKAVQYVFINR